MKINLIIPSFYPATVYGGPIFSTLHTCEELAKLDDVEVKVSTTNTNMTEKLELETGVWKKFEDYFYVKYYNETKVDKFSLSLFLNIWKDIKEADVVHIQSIFNTPTPISLLYAKMFKKPILLSPRGSLGDWCIDNGSKFKSLWLKYFIQPFALSVTWHATAQEEKQEIQALFPDAKVAIVSNGIDYEAFQDSNTMSATEYVEKFTTQKRDVSKIIISMGRLQKKKGFDILINAFKSILDVYPEAVLLIAGPDEGEQESLNKLVKELDIESSAFLIGAISGQDKVDFLANADVFALPSHNENFGNVYLESLASGTPIVASTNTPWKAVETNKCGKWVNNSVDKTAHAILTLLNEDEKSLSSNAKEFAQQYSWKSIAEKFEKLYQLLLKNEIRGRKFEKHIYHCTHL